MNKKDICIAELGNMEEAHILRGLLQSENIVVFLSDINPHEGDIPIPIHVPLDQKEKAQKVVDLFYENMKPRCPKCKSSNLKTDYLPKYIYFTVYGITSIAVLSSLIITVIAIIQF